MKKLWIRNGILSLIDDRNVLVSNGDSVGASRFQMSVEILVCKDLSDWLDLLVVLGNWFDLRCLRKGFIRLKGRIR